MNDADMMRDVDYRHVLQAFSLFNGSGFDALEMVRRYASLPSRLRADQGSGYHIYRQPVSTLNDVVRDTGTLPQGGEVDEVVLRWIARLYLYALYERGIPMREAVAMVDPEWLVEHYDPLHEASLATAWDKAVRLAQS